MRALVYRTELEFQSRGANFAANQAASSQVREIVIPTLEVNGLLQTLTEQEQAAMAMPVSHWTEAQAADLSWQQEGLAVLLWVLGQVDDLTEWDQPMDIRAQITKLDLGENADGSWIATAQLRYEEEREDARYVAEIWHWRAKAHAIELGEIPMQVPPGKTIGEVMAQVIDYTAEQAEESGMFTRIGGDFPVLGKAYRQLTRQEFATIRAIATERHRALNWVQGYGGDWDDTALDT